MSKCNIVTFFCCKPIAGRTSYCSYREPVLYIYNSNGNSFLQLVLAHLGKESSVFRECSTLGILLAQCITLA